jgi:uncharacterized damage-inducible protein DinB
MAQENATLATFYENWQVYQEHLNKALAPLTQEQLALRAAPRLRSIEELARHIIGVRTGWLHNILGEGDEAFGAYHEWDQPDAPTRRASELVEGLAATWQPMQLALADFTLEALTATLTGVRKGHTYAHQRGWVVWHVLEHDLHHGGEISLTLGMHGLPAPDI